MNEIFSKISCTHKLKIEREPCWRNINFKEYKICIHNSLLRVFCNDLENNSLRNSSGFKSFDFYSSQVYIYMWKKLNKTIGKTTTTRTSRYSKCVFTTLLFSTYSLRFSFNHDKSLLNLLLLSQLNFNSQLQ